MSQFSKKIIRRHTRQKKGRPVDGKGERFSIQGMRWRLPKELTSSEVETRIMRLRSLWEDHERFCQTIVFINKCSCIHGDFLILDPAIRFVMELRPIQFSQPVNPEFDTNAESTPSYEDSGTSSSPSLSFLQRTIVKNGIMRGPIDVQWSPLAIWIADQIRLGVSPVRLPPNLCHGFFCLPKGSDRFSI